MSAPADRPLSLARLRALPVGAVIVDRDGRQWRRFSDPWTGNPGWFRNIAAHWAASYTTLWQDHRPLHLVAGD